MPTLLKLFALALCTLGTLAQAAQPIVIAHRGASGYLPEHTLVAKAMAHAQGADYIEQDIVMSKDNALIVLHDLTLDATTDVAERYPGRQREDGKHYAIDFTLAEIRQLKVTEIQTDKDGNRQAKYPGRFPSGQSSFRINTLEEELELIGGLNKSTGRQVGIYPEIKVPAFHRREGKDISAAVLQVLKRYGYHSRDDKVFLQCFDPLELKRIKTKLLPQYQMDLKLVQLIAMTEWHETLHSNAMGLKPEPYNYDWMLAPGAAPKIKDYADGIGPWFPMLMTETDGQWRVNHMVKEAHAAGLQVHPYTFRADQGQVPEVFSSFEEYVGFFLQQAGVDGVFTDFPDRAVKVRNSLRAK
ncbi:MAG: glycerophosphodiester phosphodiesterase [Cellvibrionaceae bacterium]|nr:glycerophosphodiester phosphodiesterase [Cellvibrionaceae bacterium]